MAVPRKQMLSGDKSFRRSAVPFGGDHAHGVLQRVGHGGEIFARILASEPLCVTADASVAFPGVGESVSFDLSAEKCHCYRKPV